MGQFDEAKTLSELFELALEAAQRIDPSITDVWVFTDELIPGDREQRLAGMSFRRRGLERQPRAA